MREKPKIQTWLICVYILLVLVVSGMMSGCGSIPAMEVDEKQVDATYRHDLRVIIDGVATSGLAIVQKRDEYKLEVTPLGKIDRIVWGTCHQQKVIDQPANGWKSYSFTFKPDPTMEQSQGCPLEISVLEEKLKRNGWATIAFSSALPHRKLEASIKCDGKSNMILPGAALCQSAAGLYQRITFKEPVVQKGARPECDVMKTSDQKTFDWSMPKGKCDYVFVSNTKASNGKRLELELNTIGYTDVPVR